jgi:hypothetical protein
LFRHHRRVDPAICNCQLADATARAQGRFEQFLEVVVGLVLLPLIETDQQHAAMRFFENAGYPECGASGPYADIPAQAIATSALFAKALWRAAKAVRRGVHFLSNSLI